MNSGDEIYAPETVSNVFESADNADIYYGETEMINDKGESLGHEDAEGEENRELIGARINVARQHLSMERERRRFGIN